MGNVGPINNKFAFMSRKSFPVVPTYLAIFPCVFNPIINASQFQYQQGITQDKICLLQRGMLKNKFNLLLDSIRSDSDRTENINKIDTSLLLRAYEFADLWHKDQTRASGAPYIMHPLETFKILFNEMHVKNTNILAASLLHDLIEDTSVNHSMLAKEFNKEIADLVEGVTKLSIKGVTKDIETKESLKKLVLAIANDPRAGIIKFADRLHNIRTAQFLGEERAKKMVQETINIIAPIAGRLGLWDVKGKLEDASFKILDEEAYKETRKLRDDNAIKKKRVELYRTFYNLIKEEGVQIKLKMKDIFRFNKLLTRDENIDLLYSSASIRIIVKSVLDCYRLLGKVHSKFKHINGTFEDKIFIEQDNLYQSLHTTVMIDRNPVVVLIRAEEMDDRAGRGILAIIDNQEKFAGFKASLNKWIIQIEKIKTEDILVNIEEVVGYKGKIKVKTPLLKEIELKEGSTPLDFAIKVHSDLLLNAKSCTITRDGQVITDENRNKFGIKEPILSAALKKGDMVEIITDENPQIIFEWMDWVKPGDARSYIKSYLRKKRTRNDFVRYGKRKFMEAATKYFITTKDIMNSKLIKSGEFENFMRAVFDKYPILNAIIKSKFEEEDIENASKEGKIRVASSFSDLYYAIGAGEISADIIINEFLTMAYKAEDKKYNLNIKMSYEGLGIIDIFNIAHKLDLISDRGSFKYEINTNRAYYNLWFPISNRLDEIRFRNALRFLIKGIKIRVNRKSGQ